MRTENRNIAYEPYYQAIRQEYDVCFAEVYHKPHMDSVTELTKGYSVRTEVYSGVNEVNSWRFTCGESHLLDARGRTVYTWRNLDMDGYFYTLFQHKNGNSYLIFRTELYGYSVYELESGNELHYVPSQVYPREQEKFEEVFIWTSVNYDPSNDLLAVSGCIWAAPFSTIVLDFSHPLQVEPAERWLDIRTLIDPDYVLYGDIEFVRWEDSALILRGSDVEDGAWREITVPIEQLQQSLM